MADDEKKFQELKIEESTTSWALKYLYRKIAELKELLEANAELAEGNNTAIHNLVNGYDELKEQFQTTLDFTVVLDKDITFNKEVLRELKGMWKAHLIDEHDFDEDLAEEMLEECIKLNKLDGEKSVIVRKPMLKQMDRNKLGVDSTDSTDLEPELMDFLWLDGIKSVIKKKCPNHILVEREDLENLLFTNLFEFKKKYLGDENRET